MNLFLNLRKGLIRENKSSLQKINLYKKAYKFNHLIIIMKNFDSTLEEVEKSQCFKNFKDKNKDAFLCAGFFVIDYEQGKNQQQLDYCIREEDIYTFMLDKDVNMKKAETLEGHKENLPKLSKDMKVDLDDAEKILQEKIKEDNVPEKLVKVIAVLQVFEDKQIWNLNCVLSGMQILRAHIDSETGDVLKFEKKSMLDFVKKVK